MAHLVSMLMIIKYIVDFMMKFINGLITRNRFLARRVALH